MENEKLIDVQDVINLLENATAVRVDGEWVCFPSVDEDALYWLELDDLSGMYNFDESCNPRLKDGKITLIDIEGEDVTIELLVVKNASVE